MLGLGIGARHLKRELKSAIAALDAADIGVAAKAALLRRNEKRAEATPCRSLLALGEQCWRMKLDESNFFVGTGHGALSSFLPLAGYALAAAFCCATSTNLPLANVAQQNRAERR